MLAPESTFSHVKGLSTRVDHDGEPYSFVIDCLDDGETAAVLLEIYRRGSEWKVRAVGQGYDSGLAGLATDFGIHIEDEMLTQPPAPVTGHTPAPGSINLTKSVVPLGKSVVLEKKGGATISLDKRDRSIEVVATLEWDGGTKQRQAQGADLELYGLFIPRHEVVPDRKKHTVEAWEEDPGDGGVVYWNNLGRLTSEPYIQHMGDSEVPGSETIRIRRPDEQGYVLKCAYSAAKNGTGSFKSFGAKAVVTDGRSRVEVPLYNRNSLSYCVVITKIDFNDPEGIIITGSSQ